VAQDSTPFIGPAVLVALGADAAVVALVPAARHYSMQRPPNPVWPFIAYGTPIAAPFVASCLDGTAVTVAVHNYAVTTGTGAGTVGGEEAAAKINAAVAAALDGLALELDTPYPATAHLTWTGSQVMQDGTEADKFHGFATFTITVSS